jgi:hypothetical protein
MNANGAAGGDLALFVAMPERHLLSAASLDGASVVLPLGRLGDVPRSANGCRVYCVALDDEGVAGPAATWRGTFAGWSAPDDDDLPADPTGLPPTWLEDRAAGAAPADGADTPGQVEDAVAQGEDDDDDDDDDDDRPRQVFVTVHGLVALERRDWIFANEVVPKQRRGARSFVPMTPTLVRLPD